MSFLLWCDVVTWFSCRSTTEMRYSKYPKSHGQIVKHSAERGHFTPQCSTINFAVPAPKSLRKFDPYGVQGGRQPGIYQDIMLELSKALEKKSACLTFDGKKIKQGLTEDSGDVDLLGFEQVETLAERQLSLEEDIFSLNTLQESVESMTLGDTCTNLRLLPQSYKEYIRLKYFIHN